MSIMEELLALERRRERNRVAQRRHRENAKTSTKGTRPQVERSGFSNPKSLPQQRIYPGQAANRSSIYSRSSDQDGLPCSADVGSGLQYSVDSKSAQNLFSDAQFSPHASEYSHIGPTWPETLQSGPSPFTMDTVFSTSSSKAMVGPSLCANCHAYGKPHDSSATITSSANTTTWPVGQDRDQDPARVTGVGSRIWTTPLHISVTQGHLWAVRLLLDRGADPNAIDGAGSTVLHTAVQSGHHTIVRELLRHHADPSSMDLIGWLPLHYAAEAGDENCMRALLKAGGE